MRHAAEQWLELIFSMALCGLTECLTWVLVEHVRVSAAAAAVGMTWLQRPHPMCDQMQGSCAVMGHAAQAVARLANGHPMVHA